MLQPDLFFSYGLASGLAMAGSGKLKKEPSPFVNKYFLAAMLWLSLCYIPQILYLLWRFPAWESMFAARSFSDYPPWFVSLYSIATMVMGALGFYITYYFLKTGKTTAAGAQVIWSLAAAIFLVTVGWDGAGYKRLLYTGTGADWANGVAYPLADFFSSPIFKTLLWLEAIVLIPYAVLFIKYARETYNDGT